MATISISSKLNFDKDTLWNIFFRIDRKQFDGVVSLENWEKQVHLMKPKPTMTDTNIGQTVENITKRYEELTLMCKNLQRPSKRINNKQSGAYQKQLKKSKCAYISTIS